ncbi:TlpA family protein disulfide reductase [Ornithinibacillus halotolerans]|uniref:Glutathione peroxidase homolog BsaA n=1 Tax=Ornithinibacillus halotolerans TaxID=1274357 RepID=A0A916RP60_9BACI|nr:TlpA disulfide reductase family protein [Ornithinibacillus halotolerans]GGA63907.1 thioredoxin-like protein YneN [Ornithinibacillus halotolerans]
MGKPLAKKIPAIIGVLFIAFLVFLLIQNILETTKQSKTDTDADSLAPNFTATTLSGEEVSLEDYKGKPVLINFWASWCGPCRKEMPYIQEAYEQYKDEGLEVLAINFREKDEAIEKYLDENPTFDFTVLRDDGTINDLYKVIQLPTTFFINTDGTIESSYPAELSEEALHVFIQEILPGKKN